MIEISATGIEQAEEMLRGIPGGAQDALSMAITKGRAKLKSEVSSEIVKTYSISKTDLRTDTTITVGTKKSSSGVVGTVLYSGKKLPLYRFDISQKSPSGRTLVSAGNLRATGRTAFSHGFVQKMQSGHIGLFQRQTNSRKISEVVGQSVAQMAEKVDVREQAEEAAAAVINSEIGNAITKVLDKYKG